jgi:hypothetical protein
MRPLLSAFLLTCAASLLGVLGLSIDTYLLRHAHGRDLITITIFVHIGRQTTVGVPPIIWPRLTK